MNIQIRQIKGDLVELLFNPKDVDLRVGENLSLREKGSDRGLIVQIIEFRTVNYPSLLADMMEQLADVDDGAPLDLTDLDEDVLSEIRNLKLAIAKIRKVVQWNQTMAQAQLAGSQT